MRMFATPPLPPPTIPAPVIREDVRYYVIEGRSEPELVAQMNAKGYLTEHGRYWGYTSPQQKWSFDTKPVDGRCYLVDPKVVLIITITLPTWTPPPGTSAAMITKWRAFDRAGRHHEGEHAQISRDAARELIALMRKHRSDVSCSGLDASLQAEGRAIMRKADAANAELDKRTGHGATEGVAISW
jgi:predicted secreted Zn-dependent protease